MVRVHLVRHAMPVVDPGRPPWRWVLDDDARAAAARLADNLPTSAVVVSSTEPKAVATAEAVAARHGLSMATDTGVAEVHRPGGFDPGHRAKAAAYLAGGPDACGVGAWEPRSAVVARFDAAVVRHCVDGRDLVVATHGMAMSLWAAHVTRRSDVVSLWQGLRFPDIVTVDFGSGVNRTRQKGALTHNG